MNLKQELIDRLGVPENWDKYDYRTQRYSFDDMQEVLEDIVKKITIPVAVSRFIFTEAANLKMQCNEMCVTVDPCHEDDKYVDIVIYDDSWNELKRTKTLNGL